MVLWHPAVLFCALTLASQAWATRECERGDERERVSVCVCVCVFLCARVYDMHTYACV